MELIDLVVGPILLFLLLAGSFVYSRTIPQNLRAYFLPAFLAKIIGALAIGLIYSYYYGSGDTFAYHKAAGVLNSAFGEDVSVWFSMMASSNHSPESMEYVSKMSRYTGGSEYFLIRIIAFFGLLTGNSYLGEAFLVATFSFLGSWCFYRVLVRRYPDLNRPLAFGVLFIPSVVFWGSGLLKDSIIIGCLGIVIYGFELLSRKQLLKAFLFLLVGGWLLVNVRSFMIPALLLPLLVMLAIRYTLRISHFAIRWIVSLLAIATIAVAFLAMSGRFVQELTNFAREAEVSANYLYRVSVKKEGSAYYLGRLDGSVESVVSLAPSAVWVSLFRPYPWEVNNVMMLLTALESLVLFLAFFWLLFKTRVVGMLGIVGRDSYLQFAVVFVVFFAFVVGITSFNFGALARYRAPILPFFVSALVIIWYRFKVLSRGYGSSYLSRKIPM